MVARNEIYWADLGPQHGLREACTINCDSVMTLLRYSLDIVY